MNIAKIRNTSYQYTRVCSLQIINVLFQSKATIILYHTIQYHLTADQYCKSDQALHSSTPPAHPSLCNRTMHWEIVIHHSQLR